jgi:hypothetical protein
MRQREKSCIEGLATILRKLKLSHDPMICWVDDGLKPGMPDAIIRPFLIEHTSVDSIQGLRKKDHSFLSVVKNLSDEFRGRLSYRLEIDIFIDEIAKGTNWSVIGQALREWIQNGSALLPEAIWEPVTVGNGKNKLYFHARRSYELHTDGVVIRRHLSSGYESYSDIKARIEPKLEKLVNNNFSVSPKNLLIVECYDILSCYIKFYYLVKANFNGWPVDLDEFWYVEHCEQNASNYYDLKRGYAFVVDNDKKLIRTSSGDKCRL